MRYILLFVLVACSFCSAPVPLASSESMIERLETYCDNQHDPDIAGGFALSAVKEGNVIFKKAYGTANVEYDLSLTTASMFDFASIGKQFTGWAVAKLITEGRISPDDDIHEYMPELPDFGHKITISHLLYHTSGLRDWVGLMKLAGKQYTDVHSKETLLKLIGNQKDLNFTPGEEFAYSNTGYLLLAEAVGKVTGQSFADWCRENIFEPLEMKNTRFLKSHAEIITNRAMAYNENGGHGYVNCFSQLDSPGSSSLYSTLDDMTIWLKAISERKFGGSEVWDIMMRKGALNNGERVNYGYGLSHRTHKKHAAIGHGGSWLGYLSDLVYYPEQNVGYVLMITRDPAAVSISGKVDDILLEIHDSVPATQDTKEQQSAEITAIESTGENISESFLQNCIGKYYSREKAIMINVRDEDGIMKIDFPMQIGLDVVALPGNRFYVEKYKLTFTFHKDENGNVTALEFIRENKNSYYKKLQLDVSRWTDISGLLGEYYCDELQVTYNLILKENSLIAGSILNPDVELVRYDENYFLGNSWWFSSIRLTRNEQGEICGFLLNADQSRIRKLRFRKKTPFYFQNEDG